MTSINRVRVVWSGFLGSPGVSTFYCTDVTSFRPALATWLGHMGAYMPNMVDMQIAADGDVILDTDGSIVAGWADSAIGSIPGVGSPDYSAPVGFQARWLTDTVVDGHRLRGRTYLVPMTGSIIDAYGGLNPTVTTALQGFSDDFVGDVADNMLIWHRPRDVSVRHPVARAGSSAPVTGCVVPSKLVVLTSRRD